MLTDPGSANPFSTVEIPPTKSFAGKLTPVRMLTNVGYLWEKVLTDRRIVMNNSAFFNDISGEYFKVKKYKIYGILKTGMQVVIDSKLLKSAYLFCLIRIFTKSFLFSSRIRLFLLSKKSSSPSLLTNENFCISSIRFCMRIS